MKKSNLLGLLCLLPMSALSANIQDLPCSRSVDPATGFVITQGNCLDLSYKQKVQTSLYGVIPLKLDISKKQGSGDFQDDNPASTGSSTNASHTSLPVPNDNPQGMNSNTNSNSNTNDNLNSNDNTSTNSGLGNSNPDNPDFDSRTDGDMNVGSGNTGHSNNGDDNDGIGNNGSDNTGIANNGSGSEGLGNNGDNNWGIGNNGDSNCGGGNNGSQNCGVGNNGDNNDGLGNNGDNNQGIGNRGDGQTGFGQSNGPSVGNIGSGNNGSLNIGDGNVGNGNDGTLNIGDGNSGSRNVGDLNVGQTNIGDGNLGSFNSGDDNTGSLNSGDENVGDRNVGDSNTGDRNIGDSNFGDDNVGSGNTGHRNAGNANTGDDNIGDSNQGDNNHGDSNIGNHNTGDSNTGDQNVGSNNTGDNNNGSSNTGSFNDGSSNTGDYNIGDSNDGSHNTGNGNIGDENVGNSNTGNANVGNGNTGNQNDGNGNNGDQNIGNGNTGSHNTGDGNNGDQNVGSYNTGSGNNGSVNNGDQNSGSFNTGSHNTGNFNNGDQNVGSNNTGDKNQGSFNQGDNNTGNANLGSNNQGDLNIGSDNIGNANIGDRNVGSLNLGDDNTGYLNYGDGNTGDLNQGNMNYGNGNIGDRNIGHNNVGDRNIGTRNEGDDNRGNYNIGDRNVGNHNNGDDNRGNNNVGDSNRGSHNVGNGNIGNFHVGDNNEDELIMEYAGVKPLVIGNVFATSSVELVESPEYPSALVEYETEGDAYIVRSKRKYTAGAGAGFTWNFPNAGDRYPELARSAAIAGVSIVIDSSVHYEKMAYSQEEIKKHKNSGSVPWKAKDLEEWRTGDSVTYRTSGGVVLSLTAMYNLLPGSVGAIFKGSHDYYIQKLVDGKVFVEITRSKLQSASLSTGAFFSGASVAQLKNVGKSHSFVLDLNDEETALAYEDMLRGNMLKVQDIADAIVDLRVTKVQSTDIAVKGRAFSVGMKTPFIQVASWNHTSGKFTGISDSEIHTSGAKIKREYGIYTNSTSSNFGELARTSMKAFYAGTSKTIKGEQEFTDSKGTFVWLYETNNGTYKKLRRALDKLHKITNLKSLFDVKVSKTKEKLNYTKLEMKMDYSRDYTQYLMNKDMMALVPEITKAAIASECADIKLKDRKYECINKQNVGIKSRLKKISKALMKMKKVVAVDNKKFVKHYSEVGRQILKNKHIFAKMYELGKACGLGLEVKLSGAKIKRLEKQLEYTKTESCEI